MLGVLDPDVILHSPVSFKPFEGIHSVERLFRILLGVFEDFRYIDQLESERVSVLVFKARVGTRLVDGVDLLRWGPGGTVTDFTVMVRPLSAAIALADVVGPQLMAEKP